MATSSPEAAVVKCPHCGKTYKNKRSLREHKRHHCKRCKTASPRKYTPSRCKHCDKVFHSANSLRVHASTQHVKEYARSPRSVKEHRVPLRTRRQSSERQIPIKEESGGARHKERSSGARHSQASPAHESEWSATDRLHQEYARTGDRRSREIWDKVLRQQQLQNKSTRGGGQER